MDKLLTNTEWAAVKAHCAWLEAIGRPQVAASIRQSLEDCSNQIIETNQPTHLLDGAGIALVKRQH